MAGRGDPVTKLRDRAEQQRLSKAHLLTPKIVEQEVEIESLGGTVVMRGLTHDQRRELQERSGFRTDHFDENLMVLLSIQYSLVDPKLTEEEVMELNKQDYMVIDELNMHVQMMNLVGRAEDLKKGSAKIQSSDSASSSPDNSGSP